MSLASEFDRLRPTEAEPVKAYFTVKDRALLGLVKEHAAEISRALYREGCVELFVAFLYKLQFQPHHKVLSVEELAELMQRELGPYAPIPGVACIAIDAEEVPTVDLSGKYTAEELRGFARDLEEREREQATMREIGNESEQEAKEGSNP